MANTPALRTRKPSGAQRSRRKRRHNVFQGPCESARTNGGRNGENAFNELTRSDGALMFASGTDGRGGLIPRNGGQAGVHYFT